MQINTEKIEFLVGDVETLNSIIVTPALPMFSDTMTSFLADLSRKLMDDKRSRGYQDVMSYAYWIRKGSIEKTKKQYTDFENRLGRGVSFHIAPSNVPINFAVSMTSALLAGNGVIIRVSNKEFEQVSIVCDAINDLINEKYESLRNYFCIIRYPHDDVITQQISSICDIRIIWGGDETIRRIRKAELPSRAIEMTFADRHSIAMINADEYIKKDTKDIAKGFYTDTYYTDQNACSSPRIVVWFGNDIEKARMKFWEELSDIVREQYDMKAIQAVDKYNAFCDFSMRGFKAKKVSNNNLITRVEVFDLTEDLMDYKMGGGYFFEYSASKLDDITPLLGKRCQTISLLGIDKQEVRDLVLKTGVRGVDRIVDLGQTMGLEFIWDGYKMIEAMTRLIYIGM